MIQRIQSIFLLLVAILMTVFLFVPTWEKVVPASKGSTPTLIPQEKVTLNACKVTHDKITANATSQKIGEGNTIYIAIIAALSAVVALFSIFQFKKRLLQIKLGFLNSLLISAVLGAVFLGIKSGNNLLPAEGSEEFLIGFYLPIVSLLLNLIANRYIRKDEELVRSVDRIR